MMHPMRLIALISISLGLSLAACLAAEQPATPDGGMPLILGKYEHSATGSVKSNECAFMHRIDSWTDLDDFTLIIYAPNARTPYLVQTSEPCSGLRYTTAISVTKGTGGRLCSFGGGAVLLNQNMTPNRCLIGAIHKISQDEAEQVKAEFENGHYDR